MTENTSSTAAPEVPKRYCAYDKTLLRFVGKVGTRAEALEVKKNGPKGHDLEVREV